MYALFSYLKYKIYTNADYTHDITVACKTCAPGVIPTIHFGDNFENDQESTHKPVLFLMVMINYALMACQQVPLWSSLPLSLHILKIILKMG